ncbi:lamin tail domain-containing protein [Haloarcula onubensis]|uniref:Lamin tail domain-containing protein n=1 Tax=Haloarcula onubensis TaxID=2950539 RepID=A0ABU2FIG4_9EURY|nr:lamin tail domain-containing protein [Halomicroarcula sp. S3CR25-11]MDS0280543.1 lamin tail domain-containing protein [Halomicroarcula sp. S3CR25-11]
MTDSSADWQTTANGDLIREWASARDAVPTAVERSDGQVELRVERADDTTGRRLRWERFVELMDEAGLALRYRERQSSEDLQGEYEFVRRGDSDGEAEKTAEPRGVDSDQLATSDTGGDEPAIFDRTESEPSGGDPEASAQSTPMTESARGSVDAAEAVVLDELHEQRVGPDSWQGSDEYLVLENEGEAPVDMSGWVVETEAGESYRFDDGTTVQPGDQLTLHGDAGDDSETHRYWDVAADVLPASGTTVRVETADGERVLTETYKSGG